MGLARTGETLAIGEILVLGTWPSSPADQSGLAWRPAGVRKALPGAGGVQAVLRRPIQLPEGVVWTGTMIGALLAVCHPVGAASSFFAIARPYRSGLCSTRRSAQVAGVKSSSITCSIPRLRIRIALISIEDAAAQDFILMLARYRPSIASGPAMEAIETFGGRELGDLAEIIRPLAIPKDDDGEHVVYEAGVRHRPGRLYRAPASDTSRLLGGSKGGGSPARPGWGCAPFGEGECDWSGGADRRQSAGNGDVDREPETS